MAPDHLIAAPFAALSGETIRQSGLRAAVTAAYRRPEPDCIRAILPAATLNAAQKAQSIATGTKLVTALRAKPAPAGAAALIREYALSSAEGVALMCLAEALLRIPDAATRDALIRDKIGGGNWRAHLGGNNSLFVNAATWGLVITGRLTNAGDDPTLAGALTRLLARGGETLIRKAVDLAIRLMGEQFVLGETIEKALARALAREETGFRYSYDMLGEAALTAADAAHYLAAYRHAITAIGAAANGSGIYNGPGISIKLSALHPRYARGQRGRVLAELLPRLTGLAHLARTHNIGFNIDAEETDRLDLSLDLLERLCADPDLAGWHGIGFVVQAYQKRAPFVLDYCIDLARRSGHRLMLRLVKGAYWDAEIKRAQEAGLADFPVFTRKIHTDISYLACARKLLDAGPDIYPQFATHNAMTVAAIHAMGQGADYEFQCLHGMGEDLYSEIVGPKHLNIPCRIYAPVGGHETLLAYLVRRLLENGANSSFVNRIADPAIALTTLLEDPVDAALAMTVPGAPHDRIAAPPDLFSPARRNAAGLDLSDEHMLHTLADQLTHAPPPPEIAHATPGDIETAFARANNTLPPAARAACLNTAANLLEDHRPALIALLVNEAGKTLPNAISEIREAVDFLRYYAAGISGWDAGYQPLGTTICISPWNFPLAIFLGQAAAAFAAGNAVIAKPAEETPRIAAFAATLLARAGIPRGALAVLHGDGATGAALVHHQSCNAVIFTGSTEVARLIQADLARRVTIAGQPVPLIAETGGINAMIVDSSALPEQVVADVLYSAFDSAGQRCSALRLLCVQEDAAPRLLTMLRDAMAELSLGPPDRLATDIGPVITADAACAIRAHIAAMQARGAIVTRHSGPESPRLVAPAIIELTDIAQVNTEIFGPVLHVVTYPRTGLDALINAINAKGYGLTFGMHTRIDAMAAYVSSRIKAGNIYINRNIVGAVVGVQPFGGHGLSGTGPKAGGPLYLRRLLAAAPHFIPAAQNLPGPVGEQNVYALHPRGAVFCRATTQAGRLAQADAIAAAGSHAVFHEDEPFAAALLEGDGAAVQTLARSLAARPGRIIPLFALSPAAIATGAKYNPVWLMTERVVTTNTAAAGGNASLMALG